MKRAVAAVTAFFGRFFSKPDVVAAGHTLWQAALGSGGVAVLVDSVTKRGVDLTLAEQGLSVIGTACLASLGSLVKAFVKSRARKAKFKDVSASIARLAEAGEAAQASSAKLAITVTALTNAVPPAAEPVKAVPAKKAPAKKAVPAKKATPAKKAPAKKAVAPATK